MKVCRYVWRDVGEDASLLKLQEYDYNEQRSIIDFGERMVGCNNAANTRVMIITATDRRRPKTATHRVHPGARQAPVPKLVLCGASKPVIPPPPIIQK